MFLIRMIVSYLVVLKRLLVMERILFMFYTGGSTEY